MKVGNDPKQFLVHQYTIGPKQLHGCFSGFGMYWSAQVQGENLEIQKQNGAVDEPVLKVSRRP